MLPRMAYPSPVIPNPADTYPKLDSVLVNFSTATLLHESNGYATWTHLSVPSREKVEVRESGVVVKAELLVVGLDVDSVSIRLVAERHVGLTHTTTFTHTGVIYREVVQANTTKHRKSVADFQAAWVEILKRALSFPIRQPDPRFSTVHHNH